MSCLCKLEYLSPHQMSWNLRLNPTKVIQALEPVECISKWKWKFLWSKKQKKERRSKKIDYAWVWQSRAFSLVEMKSVYITDDASTILTQCHSPWTCTTDKLSSRPDRDGLTVMKRKCPLAWEGKPFFRQHVEFSYHHAVSVLVAYSAIHSDT